MRHDAFIGRWVIFHNGHLHMIEKVFNKNKRPILILIMDTDEEPLAKNRKEYISKVFTAKKIPHDIYIIPPIASINWGRDVGYETNYIEVDDAIKEISGTDIRNKMKNKDNTWRNYVPD